MSESLKDKTIKGGAWSLIDNVAGYFVTFVIGIILARLLSPDEYGLIGIITIFTAICDCFINAGFTSALIRKKNASENDFNTVFIANLATSLILYFVLFFAAPFIADYFERQELTSLTRVSSLGMVIGSLAIVQRTKMTKRIDFKVQTKIAIFSAIIKGVVGISLAYLGFGVWALVAQELTQKIISTSCLWYVNRWIPQFKFSKSSFRELFGYGSKMLLSNLLDTVWRDIYKVIIGKIYTPSVLGLYSRASGFCQIFSSNITGVVQRVTFPVLSEVQDDNERLKKNYQRIIKLVMLITFVCIFMLAAIAKPMILVLIGEKWIESASFIQIICFSSMLYPLHALNLNMLQVQGRSDLFLRLEIIKKCISIIPILLGIFIGIYWMLIGSVFTGLISYYLNAYYSGPLLNYGIKEQIKDILPSFCIALIGAFAAYLISFISGIIPIVILLIQLILNIGIVFLLCKYFKLQEYIEIKNIVISMTKKLKKK